MKRPLEFALWCDCESDEERAVFLHSGRSVETGVVAPILVPELAEAFLDRASLRAEVENLKHSVSVLVEQKLTAQAEVERLTAENTSLATDAKLGRMVRFNAKRFGITKKDHSFQHQNGRSWLWWSTIEAALQDAGFDAPEEALEKAGVKP